jgi:hypothetical protein
MRIAVVADLRRAIEGNRNPAQVAGFISEWRPTSNRRWPDSNRIPGRIASDFASNWTIAGSDAGGHRAAAIYTLIETRKLNDVDPQASLAYVLAKLPDHGKSGLKAQISMLLSVERFASTTMA